MSAIGNLEHRGATPAQRRGGRDCEREEKTMKVEDKTRMQLRRSVGKCRKDIQMVNKVVGNLAQCTRDSCRVSNPKATRDHGRLVRITGE